MSDETRRSPPPNTSDKLSALGRVLKREKRLRAHIKRAVECFSLAAAMHFALLYGCIIVRLVTVICSTFLFTIVIIVSALSVSASILPPFLFMPTSFTTAHPSPSVRRSSSPPPPVEFSLFRSAIQIVRALRREALSSRDKIAYAGRLDRFTRELLFSPFFAPPFVLFRAYVGIASVGIVSFRTIINLTLLIR